MMMTMMNGIGAPCGVQATHGGRDDGKKFGVVVARRQRWKEGSDYSEGIMLF